MKEYRFGILGAGQIAHKFAATLNYLNFPIEGVASRDIEKAKDFQNKYNIKFSYNSYQEMLNNKDIDIIYIATPHGLHYEHMKLVLDYNKHIICEKAFTLNALQAEEIFKIAKKKNLLVMEAMWTRFLPLIQYLQKIIKEQQYGVISSFEASFGFPGNLDPNNRLMSLQLGGGATLDIGVYPLNFANILGDPLEIKAEGKLSFTKVDLSMSAKISYKDFSGNIYASLENKLDNKAIIDFTNAKIIIEDFWKAEKAYIYDLNNSLIETLSYPLQFNGFEYQILSFINTLNENKIDNEIMSSDTTIKILKQTDNILRQIGVIYNK